MLREFAGPERVGLHTPRIDIAGPLLRLRTSKRVEQLRSFQPRLARKPVRLARRHVVDVVAECPQAIDTGLDAIERTWQILERQRGNGVAESCERSRFTAFDVELDECRRAIL